ncbi:MAG TPA: TonB-dependent receptor [Chitinophagaceae bacterium]
MKQTVLSILLILTTLALHSQHTLKAVIRDKNKNPLPGASVIIEGTALSAVADSTGKVHIINISDGKQTVVVTHSGYAEFKKEYTFPLIFELLEIELEEEEAEELEDIIVTATRTSRTIANNPTRVETISGEELTEKSNMKPGEIRMLLNESTGIQTQQTSATSYNSSIRIQGLDGRYTQILKDGFPLYAGFSGGLSIMQVTPLDLQQAEVIKGSSSTLYGGGAIAGLVNLVSKKPGDERELSFIANATSAKGLDLSGFYSERYNKAGLTLFASRNSGSPYDPANIGLTAIPEFERYTINPRLFLYFKERSVLDVGVNLTTEDRTGGDINYIKNGTPGYFEKNTTNRLTTQINFEHGLTDSSRIMIKGSYSRFDRKIEVPGYIFSGLQHSVFTEASYDLRRLNLEWIFGVNVLTDNFIEEVQTGIQPRDYSLTTLGAFVQNTWNTNDWLTIESGLRGDHVKDYGFSFLPRVSALFHISPQLTSRIGGGLGYKPPTIFSEDAERLQFRNVLPVDADQRKTERSSGVNVDINYRTSLFDDAVSFTVNHLFFYTRVNKPLVLKPVSNGVFEFINANGFLDTKGMETNVRLVYKDFKLFIGYTLADAHQHYEGAESQLPLTARHRLNNVLMYEKEEKLKVGLEAYYFSPQLLNDGTKGRSYWIMGLMAEKIWNRFSVFVNFENFLDVRQTKFGPVYSGSISNPQFTDIFAPVDGFVVNGGVKLRL